MKAVYDPMYENIRNSLIKDAERMADACVPPPKATDKQWTSKYREYKDQWSAVFLYEMDRKCRERGLTVPIR